MKLLKEFFQAFTKFKHILATLVLISFSTLTCLLLKGYFDPRYVTILSIVSLIQTLFIIIVLFIPNHRHLFIEEYRNNGKDQKKESCDRDEFMQFSAKNKRKD